MINSTRKFNRPDNQIGESQLVGRHHHPIHYLLPSDPTLRRNVRNRVAQKGWNYMICEEKDGKLVQRGRMHKITVIDRYLEKYVSDEIKRQRSAICRYQHGQVLSGWLTRAGIIIREFVDSQ